MPFKNFSTTSASNPKVIEWCIALSYCKRSLADQRPIMNLTIKIAKFWSSKSIFYVKNHRNHSKMNIKSGAQPLFMTLFVYCHFWSTLFTKIGPKFQTLIPNRVLICHSINPVFDAEVAGKILKWYLICKPYLPTFFAKHTN